MTVPFSFIFIFVIVPGLALITTVINITQRKKREERLFRAGIQYLKSMRQLLTHIQQHRGLTNGYLSGNTGVEADIERLESLIKKEIAEVEAVDDWIKVDTKWESIVDHWSRVNASFKHSDAEANLKQHNNLIANLLYLIDDVAYAHHLGKLGLVGATDTDWRNLLFIAEYVGQARALGMGAVSRGHCSSVLRIQLNHLRTKIQNSINSTWPEVAQKDFRYFLRVIEEQVIIDETSISPADYFRLATSCIEHVLQEFDRQIDRIQFHRQ
jgi:hypothetical protein